MPRDKMPCSYFSITASAAVIKSSSGSLMQCSVSLALSNKSFSTSITAGPAPVSNTPAARP